MTDIGTVSIRYDSSARAPISVTPDPVKISGTGCRITWSFAGPAGFSARVEFTEQGGLWGPFDARSFNCGAGRTAGSGPARPNTNGDWKYNIVVLDASGTPVSELDPTATVRENP